MARDGILVCAAKPYGFNSVGFTRSTATFRPPGYARARCEHHAEADDDDAMVERRDR
jgi:hypothetical protein